MRKPEKQLARFWIASHQGIEEPTSRRSHHPLGLKLTLKSVTSPHMTGLSRRLE
jgi:hypothetical protein